MTKKKKISYIGKLQKINDRTLLQIPKNQMDSELSKMRGKTCRVTIILEEITFQ